MPQELFFLKLSAIRPIHGAYEIRIKKKMASNRYGEKGRPPPFRSKRLSVAEGRWYFDTREGVQFGPYEDETEARKALALFIAVNASSLLADGSHIDGERPGTEERIDHMVEEIVRLLACRDELGPLGSLSWAKQRADQIQRHSKGDPRQLECIAALEYANQNLDQFLGDEPTLEYLV